MQCENYKEQIELLVTGGLDESLRENLEKHLAGCPACRMEFETTAKIWKLMGEVPVPDVSEKLQLNFNTLLTNFKKESVPPKTRIPNLKEKFFALFVLRTQFRFVYGIMLLVLGILAGWMINRPGPTAIAYDRKIDSLSIQVKQMKQLMMLSLLENPSASERIRAVGYTTEAGSTNKKIIDALFTTLNEDPNVNVRLITLEALTRFSSDPGVREGLVQSITLQESPLLQSAIADVMVKLQEKRSVTPLQKLLHKKDLNEMVKIKIEESIRKLI
jgi:hypothetical protein